MSDTKNEQDQGQPENPPIVVTLGEAGYATDIAAGRHALAADEPPGLGGDDRGPTPYELVLSGLGACTAMTLRSYADRKGWDLSGVTVRLRHENLHAKDCAECETRDGRLTKINVEIALSGELSGEQRARLMEIAEKCPVHRTLTGASEIFTSALEPA